MTVERRVRALWRRFLFCPLKAGNFQTVGSVPIASSGRTANAHWQRAYSMRAWCRAFEYDEERMAAPKPPAFETLSLHAGQHPDPATRSRAVPIYQTTSYLFDDADHAAGLFNLERAGHIYTRLSNPTTAVLEARLAALEDGVGAACTASGMAAMHLAIATLVSAGDHIVASASLYGGTINLLTHTLPRFGIATTFVKPRDLDGFP